MSANSQFEMQLESKFSFGGSSHTISSDVDGIFSSDQFDAFDHLLTSHRKALATLTGLSNEGIN